MPVLWMIRAWFAGVVTRNQLDVPELINPTQVSSGGVHSCAVDDLGVTCWGDWDDGTEWSLGNNTNVPTLRVNPTHVSAPGYSYTCAIDDTV